MKCYLQKHFPLFFLFFSYTISLLLRETLEQKIQKTHYFLFFKSENLELQVLSQHSGTTTQCVYIYISPKAYSNPLNMQQDYLLNSHFFRLHLTCHHVFIIYLPIYLYCLPHPPNYLNLRMQSYLQPPREWHDIGVQAL